MTLPIDPAGRLKQEQDGSWMLCCPECGHWGEIDEDQLHGRVSVDHSGGAEANGCRCGCTFHQTRDFFNTATRI